MRAVWPHTFVVDNNIHVHISQLRKLFGGKQGWIRTESGRGYRLAQPRHHQRPVPPVTRDTPIGRESELMDLHALVDSEPLVTLVGAPGVGKSTLARELMRERSRIGDTPAFFIELADAVPGTTITGALGTALALPLPHDPPAIVAAIAQRPTLIVLDGCDAFIDEAASFCQALATFCAGVQIVVTSREPLHIAPERTWRVPPLDTPARTSNPADLSASPAVRLFIARMGESAGHTPTPTGEAAPATLALIAALCRRAGGNPLLLELTAARAAALGVSCVLEQSDEQWLALANVMRDVPSRHRSLTAAYASSCARLAPQELGVLARLAALPDAFTIEAACAIAPRCGIDSETMLDVLAALVLKSLIDVEATPTSAMRGYRIGNMLRAFARRMRQTETPDTADTAPLDVAEAAPLVVEHLSGGDAVAARHPAGRVMASPAAHRGTGFPPTVVSASYGFDRAMPPRLPTPSGHVWRAVSSLDAGHRAGQPSLPPMAQSAPIPYRVGFTSHERLRACRRAVGDDGEKVTECRRVNHILHPWQGKRHARREPS